MSTGTLIGKAPEVEAQRFTPAPDCTVRAKSNLARNVFFNFAGYGLNIVVAFFIAPLTVHRLGHEPYGIWALIQQLMAYTSLCEFGIRIAVTRKVAQLAAVGDQSKINQVLSTAGLVVMFPAALVLGASGLVAYYLPRLFSISPGLLFDSRVAVLLVGGALAIALPGGMFSAALVAVSRYDLLNARNLITLLLRALLLWYFLTHGYGLVTVALIYFLAVAAGYALDFLFAASQLPTLKLGLGLFDWSMMRGLLHFSFYVFVGSIAGRLILWSDNLVVGFFLGPVAVTFYAVGGSLIQYARDLVGNLTMVYGPLAANLEALADQDALRRLFVGSSKLGMVAIMPAVVALMLAGPQFLALWMGHDYALASGPVLVALTVALPFNPLGAVRSHILYATYRHKVAAWVGLGEAVANLALSIWGVRHMGIVGVAWGTVVPALISGLVVMPLYTCKILGVSFGHYLKQVLVRPLVVSLPGAAVLGWMANVAPGLPSWPKLLGSIALSFVIYAVVAWKWALDVKEREVFLANLQKVKAVLNRRNLRPHVAPSVAH